MPEMKGSQGDDGYERWLVGDAPEERHTGAHASSEVCTDEGA
jgi:hypothetical protein